MEKNNYLKMIIIVGLLLVIIIISAYKAYQIHIEKLYYVVNQQIKEAAIDCYIDKKCEGKIKLQDLYDKEYLKEKMIDPISKEEMDNNMCINKINGVADFCK